MTEPLRVTKIERWGVLSGHDYLLSFFGFAEAVNELIVYDNVSIKFDSNWSYFKKRNRAWSEPRKVDR